MPDPNLYGKKLFHKTHTHATAARAQSATPSSARVFITDVIVSSDKAGAILTIKDTTNGTLFQVQIPTGAGTPAGFQYRFDTPIIGQTDEAVFAEVDGTSACKANIAGFIA